MGEEINLKHRLRKINEDAQTLYAEISSDLRTSQDHMEQIADEYQQMNELSG